MSKILQIKRRVSGNAGLANNLLARGEIAYNEVDDTLYYGKLVGSDVVATPIAGPGSFLTSSSQQTQTIVGDKTYTGAVNLGANAVATTQDVTSTGTAIATTQFVRNLAQSLDGGSF
jgi:hypothetical protein